ncbi:hypothetical protein Peur_048781 [Populus x canadensis]|uniref:Stress-response A/B barrel domain-containing protein n=1 Tax=Populus deltoides TaxID=3696 RepID=A0A8T2ZKK5_POPDE|nr:hypothetical protein H0E87_005678 [Populus deltoides]
MPLKALSDTDRPFRSQLTPRLNMRRNWTVKVKVCSKAESSSFPLEKRGKVVEHACLLKAEQVLSDEDEQETLDYLNAFQYQMRGIAPVSLGRISNDKVGNYTRAVFMRLKAKEDFAWFYENPFYLEDSDEHVMPYCHVNTITTIFSKI